MPEHVVLLGASADPSRYAHMAQQRLLSAGHSVTLVHPTVSEIDGHPVVPTLRHVDGPVDTLTLYVGPPRSEALLNEILALHPCRIIMNPGAESLRVAEAARAAGIEVLAACTLTMLAAHTF